MLQEIMEFINSDEDIIYIGGIKIVKLGHELQFCDSGGIHCFTLIDDRCGYKEPGEWADFFNKIKE